MHARNIKRVKENLFHIERNILGIQKALKKNGIAAATETLAAKDFKEESIKLTRSKEVPLEILQKSFASIIRLEKLEKQKAELIAFLTKNIGSDEVEAILEEAAGSMKARKSQEHTSLAAATHEAAAAVISFN